MARYIDVDKLIELMKKEDALVEDEDIEEYAKEYTEDVAPIVNGKWLPQFVSTRDLTNIFSCSNCNVSVRLLHKKVKCSYKYCPYCGAKMEE